MGVAPSGLGDNLIQNFGAEDSIVLDTSLFAALTSTVDGAIATGEFTVVSSAEEAALTEAKIAYSSATGALYYNSDGMTDGFGNGAQIATIEGAPILNMDSFTVQA